MSTISEYYEPPDYSKYAISAHTYPEGLTRASNGSNPSGMADDIQHYVGFFINVRQSSKFNNNNRIGVVNQEGQNRAVNADGQAATLAREVFNGGIGAVGGFGVTLAAANTALAKHFLNATVRKIMPVAGAVIGTTLETSSGVEGAGKLFVAEKTERISTAIFLALQSSPSVKYGVGWEAGELGTFGGLLAGGTSAADATRNSTNISSDVARRMAETMAKMPQFLSTSDTLQNVIQSTTKRVVNPQREQLFKAVGFRTFSFTYKFMPRSKTEQARVKNIIREFKFHMHPELSASGIYYLYPSEFDIVYFYKGKENSHFNKISTCALTDMQVDYGGDTFSTFDDGSPTEYTLTLTFTELETMTKERIDQGY